MPLAIRERTLYNILDKQLNSLGFSSIINPKIGIKEIDLVTNFENNKFVIEVKVGKKEKLLEGITQATDYAKATEIDNVIVLVYPEQIKKHIETAKELEELLEETPIETMFLTEYGSWTYHGLIKSAFRTLIEKIETKEKATDIEFAIRVLGESIREISSILRSYEDVKIRNVIDVVVGKFDLFMALGESSKGDKHLKAAAIDLGSYLLVNQLLFYHIFGASTKKVDILDHVNSKNELLNYFRQITDIDYAAIYSVDIASGLPDEEKLFKIVSKIVTALKAVRPQHVEHDLLGRLFHELLPFETRKILAAFYTNPKAAELLASLTIDRYDEKIIDPSCGSGTLLVAAYRRKMRLAKEQNNNDNVIKLHKRFVEDDITGIDLMPFASHLTAVNLSSQNIEITTNKLRVGVYDSLELIPNMEIRPFSREIQMTFKDFKLSKSTKHSKIKGATGLQGSGKPFMIEKVDVVIMNPPFTDREKMPKEFRDKLLAKSEDNEANRRIKALIDICGSQVNLWGYFLVLSDKLVKEGGKIGAVIPINILRGQATEKIRKFIVENYHIQYIIKSTSDIAFSEGAAFKDILLILEKKKPKSNDKTAIVLFKKSLKDINIQEFSSLSKAIRQQFNIGKEFKGEYVETYYVNQSELTDNINNLMKFIGTSNIQSTKILSDFTSLLNSNSSSKLRMIKKDEIREGFHASPMGLSELVFLTRPLDKGRVSRGFMIIRDEDEKYVTAEIKNSKITFKIPKSSLVTALRTITGVRNLEIGKICDYFVLNEFKGFDMVLSTSKWKGKKLDWNYIHKKTKGKYSYLAIPHRYRLSSPNTYQTVAYHENKFICPHAFTIFTIDNKDTCKILSLYLNSIIFITQLISNKKETTGGFTEIMGNDLINMKIIDVTKLSRQEIDKLVKLFDHLKLVDFPSINKQLSVKFNERIELDRAILKVLGFSEKDADYWINELYKIVVNEFREMQKF